MPCFEVFNLHRSAAAALSYLYEKQSFAPSPFLFRKIFCAGLHCFSVGLAPEVLTGHRLCLLSHSSTSSQRNRQYRPSRVTGNGSSSRSLARSLVFSRIQLTGTANRAASCCGVNKIAVSVGLGDSLNLTALSTNAMQKSFLLTQNTVLIPEHLAACPSLSMIQATPVHRDRSAGFQSNSSQRSKRRAGTGHRLH